MTDTVLAIGFVAGQGLMFACGWAVRGMKRWRGFSYEERLREVLAFYADPTTYRGTLFLFDSDAGPLVDDLSRIDNCGVPGKRARALLKEYP